MGRGAVPSPALASGSVSFYFWPRGVFTTGLPHGGAGQFRPQHWPQEALVFIFGHVGFSLLGSRLGEIGRAHV